MLDVLSTLAVVASLGALFGVVYLIILQGKKYRSQNQKEEVIAIKSEVSNLNSNLSTFLSTVITNLGELKSSSQQMTSGIKDIQTFTELLRASSQKRGQFGEVVINQYLEMLPREMWESQFTIPGGNGRVDYAIRMYSNGKQLYLPIDSKFSLPEETDDFEVLANKRALKRVQEIVQYVVPGITTDFVVMVLPSPVYYSLTHETAKAMAENKVLPAPVEGVMILCGLALRAHQAIVLQESALKLSEYAQKMRASLSAILEEVVPLEKNLRLAHKLVSNTHLSVHDAIDELDGITSRIDDRNEERVVRDERVLKNQEVSEESF